MNYKQRADADDVETSVIYVCIRVYSRVKAALFVIPSQATLSQSTTVAVHGVHSKQV